MCVPCSRRPCARARARRPRGSGGFGFSFYNTAPRILSPVPRSDLSYAIVTPRRSGALSRKHKTTNRPRSKRDASVDTFGHSAFGGTVATHAVSVGHRAWPRGFVYWPGPGRGRLYARKAWSSRPTARAFIGTIGRTVGSVSRRHPRRLRSDSSDRSVPWQSRGLLKPRRNATPMPWPVADSTGAEALRQEKCTMP